MQQAGCELVVNANEIAVVGLAEVVEHLPRIYRRFRNVVAEAERRRPDAAVLIDFPDFNFRLARELHKRGIPVIYYVSPQLWAWRQSRIELVRKYVRKMLVIFPFEEKFYRRARNRSGICGASVGGHAAADESRVNSSPHDMALDAGRQWIALLPGSRRGRGVAHLPQAAAGGATSRPRIRLYNSGGFHARPRMDGFLSARPQRPDNHVYN